MRSGNHDPIVEIGAGHKSRCRIDMRRSQWIVRRRREDRQVAPLCVVRFHDAVTYPVLDDKIRSNMPGVLQEVLVHIAQEDGV